MSLRKLCFRALLTVTALLPLAVVALPFESVTSTDLLARANPLSADLSLWAARQPLNNPGLQHILPIQFRNPKDLATGKLLVASRGLADPNFAGTVVLLIHCGEDGVVGLILNRRTDLPLSRALDLKAAKGRSDHIYLGGPVGTSSVFALVESSAKTEGAEHVAGAVYLISSKTLFEQTLSKQPDPGVFHVYLGYAGWNPEQLRKEVELGAWFIFPGEAAAVFDSHPDSLWPRMIHKTELELAMAIDY